MRVFLSRYRGYSVCPDCNGSRLRLEARQVKVQGKNLCEVCSLTVEEVLRFFEQLQLTTQEAEIAEKVLDEIRERLRFLNEVGLEYLTWIAFLPRYPAARLSAFNSRHRSDRGWWAPSMCSMSPRSGCTREIRIAW